MNSDVPIYVSITYEFFEKFLKILNDNQIKIYLKITLLAHKSENNRVLYKDLEKILCNAKFQKNKLQKELKKLLAYGLIKHESSSELGDMYYILEDSMHRKCSLFNPENQLVKENLVKSKKNKAKSTFNNETKFIHRNDFTEKQMKVFKGITKVLTVKNKNANEMRQVLASICSLAIIANTYFIEEDWSLQKEFTFFIESIKNHIEL